MKYPKGVTIKQLKKERWHVGEGVWCDDAQKFVTWIVIAESGWGIGEFESKMLANYVAREHNRQIKKRGEG